MSIASRLKAFLRKVFVLPLGASLLFAFPASTNFQLKDFGYGGGGVANSTSSNYAIEGIAGEQNATRLDGTTYDLGPGLQFTNQANVPPAPTFTNPANYYNRLLLSLATGGNPTDTIFAIAISSDNFVTTNYVQSDNTVGATLGLEDYQTYSAWGGGAGFTIIGLMGFFLGYFMLSYYEVNEYLDSLLELRIVIDMSAAFVGSFIIAGIFHFLKTS